MSQLKEGYKAIYTKLKYLLNFNFKVRSSYALDVKP